MTHAFVSYVHDDSAAVRRLVGDLRRAGVAVWIDRDSLRAGERWAEAIERAIRGGAFFVACFSRAYVRRERRYMDEELAVARAVLADRSIGRDWLLPLLIDEVSPEAAGLTRDPSLAPLQTVAMAPDWGDGLRRLLATVSPERAFGRCLNALPTRTTPALAGDLPLLSLDFGTATSLLAYRDARATWVPIRGADGRSFHPSVVTFDEHWDYWVGAEAVEAARQRPLRSVSNLKRALARGSEIAVEHKRFDAVTLASLVIRHLKACAEQQLGRAVRRVLAAAPVEHGQAEQEALLAACALAGLEVVRVINESTAAGLLAAVWAAPRQPRDDALVLVVDVGGGTTDLTLIELAWVTDEWQFEVLATTGSAELGGMDYDQAVFGHLRRTCVEPWIARGAAWSAADDRRLAALAREAKEALSATDPCRVTLPDVEVAPGELEPLHLVLSRAALAAAIAPLDARLEALFDALVASRDWPRGRVPHAVLLAGLGARHWSVAAMVERRFPRSERVSRFQDSAVAQGLAIQGEVLDGRRKDHLLLDVTNRAIGVRCRRLPARRKDRNAAPPWETPPEHELWLTPADDRSQVWHTLIARHTTIPTRFHAEAMAEGPATLRVRFGEWAGEPLQVHPLAELECRIAPGRRALRVEAQVDANGDRILMVNDRTAVADRQPAPELARATVSRRHR